MALAASEGTTLLPLPGEDTKPAAPSWAPICRYILDLLACHYATKACGNLLTRRGAAQILQREDETVGAGAERRFVAETYYGRLVKEKDLVRTV